MRIQIQSVAAAITVIVLANVIGGCSNSTSCTATRGYRPAQAHGFQFEIKHLGMNSIFINKSSLIQRSLYIEARCVDLQGQRTVAFARTFALDEVRDESDHNLLAIAELKSNQRPFIQQSVSFDRFSERQWSPSRSEQHAETTISVSFIGLPFLPNQLDVFRGHIDMLVATKFGVHDFLVEASDEWSEVSTGLQFRITLVSSESESLQVHCQMKTATSGDRFDDAQWQRWYWIEVFDSNAKLRLSRRALPQYSMGDIGRWMCSLKNCTADDFPMTLRITVIDEMEMLTLPFEYYDIPLQ